MATLPTILVDGNASSPRNWATQAFGNIDEGISSADGSDIEHQSGSEGRGISLDTSFTLDNTPSDFESMDDLSWQVRYRLDGIVGDDTYTLGIRIVNGSTILAAADSGGAFQTVISAVMTAWPVIFTNSSVTAFSFVNTSATKTDWDGAQVELRGTHSQSMGPDDQGIHVDTLEFTGNYTQGGQNFTETLTTSIVATTSITDVQEFHGTETLTTSIVASTTTADLQRMSEALVPGHFTGWRGELFNGDENFLGSADPTFPSEDLEMISLYQVRGDLPYQGFVSAMRLFDWLAASVGGARVVINSTGAQAGDYATVTYYTGTELRSLNSDQLDDDYPYFRPVWVRAVLDVDNGSNETQVDFYISLDPAWMPLADVTWTLLDSPVIATADDPATPNVDPRIGASHAGEELPTYSRMFGVWVRDGIGGSFALDPDFRDNLTQGNWASLPADDGVGNTWDQNFTELVWVAPADNSLQTSIVATTTVIDTYTPATILETLQTDIVASTTAGDQVGYAEALTTSIVGSTSITDVHLRPVELGLENSADPEDDTNHTINVRMRREASDTGTVTVELRQGSTVIQTFSGQALTTSFADYSFSVTSASSITDYTDLRVRIYGSDAADIAPEVSALHLELPEAAGNAFTEDLTTSIVATTASQDALAATESLSTAVVASTTLADALGASEGLSVAVIATTTLADQHSRFETLAASITASTTEADTAGLTETLSTAITATTTVGDSLSADEVLATSITATTTSGDTAAFVETLANNLIVTTTVIDQMQGNFLEVLTTSITATTTAGDQLAATEDLSTSITATTTSADRIPYADTLQTNIIATTTSADGLVYVEALTTAIVATTTSGDLAALSEALTTSGTVTTTTGDLLAAAEALATNIVATTTVIDVFTEFEGLLETLQTLIVSSTTAGDLRSGFEAFQVLITATTTARALINKTFNVGATTTLGAVPPTDTAGEDRFTDAIGSPGPSKVSA